MDTDILLLLKYPLKLTGEELIQSTQTATLSLDQLKFILKDFVSKVSVLIQGKDIGLSHLNMIVPIHVIADGTILLPNLNRHLQTVVKRITKILEENDGRTDMAELFTEECLALKTCFGLIIEIFYLMFSWAGFQHQSNLELLKKLLISLRAAESQTPLSANRLITDCITSLTSYTTQCLEISQGVHLIKTMEVLYSITTPSNEIQKRIVAAAGKLLSKRWYNQKEHLIQVKTITLTLTR
nr:unnamed protein product [Callosobruchus analis]